MYLLLSFRAVHAAFAPHRARRFRAGRARHFARPARSHFHEHAVVSGSSTLRYSSTHRVAVTDGNTFSHVQKRCEEVLAGGDALAADPGRMLDLAQVCFSGLLIFF